MAIPPDTRPYASVPDYIYGITREIWEERGVGAKLGAYYADDCLVRAPTGLTTSMAGVAGDTLATLHQFPDRQLVGEDVIWADGGDGSFLSSHRLISVMRHTGAGRFGAPTGRTVTSRIIADCWVRDGKVREEWLVRDQAAFALCLGLEAREFAAMLLEQDRAADRAPAFLPAHDRPSAFAAPMSDDPAAAHCIGVMRALWNDKHLAAIRDAYLPGATLTGPGGEACHGWGAIDALFIAYLASFPEAALTIDSAVVNRAPERSPRVALRWSVRGTHTGWGRFGKPSGAPVYIMGLSHFTLADGRIEREWLLVDDVSVWKQLLAHEA